MHIEGMLREGLFFNTSQVTVIQIYDTYVLINLYSQRTYRAALQFSLPAKNSFNYFELRYTVKCLNRLMINLLTA